MSVNCNITVQFEVWKPDLLKKVAREHHVRMNELGTQADEFDRDALCMLGYAAEGSGIGRGPKGDMFTWGHIGNYSSVEGFVEALNDFWVDLYERSAVMNCDGIIVMFQQEQMPTSKVIEIQHGRGATTVLEMREHETYFPLFGWYAERDDRALPSEVRRSTIERKTKK